jgi:hypothetical protein
VVDQARGDIHHVAAFALGQHAAIEREFATKPDFTMERKQEGMTKGRG